MGSFDYLLKERSGYLSAFQKAEKGLRAVHQKMLAKIESRGGDKTVLLQEIALADSDVAFLKDAAAKTLATADKIAAIVD